MSEANKAPQEMSTNRFLLYIAIGLVAVLMAVIAFGALLTHFLWPTQDNLSRPVPYQELPSPPSHE